MKRQLLNFNPQIAIQQTEWEIMKGKEKMHSGGMSLVKMSTALFSLLLLIGITIGSAYAKSVLTGYGYNRVTNNKVIGDQPPIIISGGNITVNAEQGSCGAKVTYNVPLAYYNLANKGYIYKGSLNGHAYFYSPTSTTPAVAHAEATALGGHLVTISDETENAFVSTISYNFFWIGLTDKDEEGVFKWVTGEPITYTKWRQGEPNDYLGEDWGTMDNETWNDNSGTAHYVIEFEGGNIPITLTSGLSSGATFPVGTTTVTYMAKDASGNEATTSFTVTVEDKQLPTIIAPENVNIGACQTVALGTPVAGDNCSIASVTNNAPATFPVGVTTVTWTVTDASGNTATATQTVTTTTPVSVSIADAYALGSGVSANTIYPGYDLASTLTLVAAPAGGNGPYTYLWSTGATTSSIVVSAPRTYTVTITDAKGCTATIIKTVRSVDVACPSGNSGKMDKVAVCHNGQMICIAASAVPAHLTHGCSLDPCSDKNNRLAKVITNMETVEPVNLTAYPIPAVGKINIEFNMVSAGAYSLEVYDLKGSLVKVLAKGNSESNKFIYNELDVTSYSEGVYFVKLLTDKQVFTKRILVAK